MRKLLAVQAVLSGMAGWAILCQWPMVDKPKINPYRLTAETIESEANHEYAVREANRVLSGLDCPDVVAEAVSLNSIRFRVPARLVAATIRVESVCRAEVVSKAGAVGLMQVMPSIHHVVRSRLQDPEANIEIGTSVLSANVRAYGTRGGLRHYFGVTEGSTKSDEYADKVLLAARR